MDADTIMAGLLHDVIEDTAVSKEQLIKKFGMTVAKLVDGVTNLTQVEVKNVEQAQADNFLKMLLANGRGHTRDYY